MLQVFQKFLTRIFEMPVLSSPALDVLLDVVQMLKYNQYLVITLQNNNKPPERLETHPWIWWSLISLEFNLCFSISW